MYSHRSVHSTNDRLQKSCNHPFLSFRIYVYFIGILYVFFALTPAITLPIINTLFAIIRVAWVQYNFSHSIHLIQIKPVFCILCIILLTEIQVQSQ